MDMAREVIRRSGDSRNYYPGEEVTRCVVLYKDEHYKCGLHVGGSNPAFVESIIRGGAADKAGIQEKDRIIKINGRTVTNLNHTEVVELLSENSYVALTLRGRPPEKPPDQFSPNPVSPFLKPFTTFSPTTTDSTKDMVSSRTNSRHSVPNGKARHSHQISMLQPSSSCAGSPVSPMPPAFLSKRSKTADIVRPSRRDKENHLTIPSKSQARRPSPVSLPTPVGDEEKTSLMRNRQNQIYIMLDEERRNLTNLYDAQNANVNDERVKEKIDQSKRRLSYIEAELAHFEKSENFGVQQPNSFDKSTSQPRLSGDSGQSCLKPGEVAILPGGLKIVPSNQVDVIPMDDDDDSEDDSLITLDSHGPFANFLDLKTRPAHLAVFLKYLICNDNPSSLMFYLITDHYQNGTAKELRKWAYEIHSSFLINNAPAQISRVDSEIISQINNVLQTPSNYEQEEILKRLFVRARQKALDEINEQLAVYRTKRQLGLGNIFGENYLQDLKPGERQKELRVMENLLMRHLERFWNNSQDFECLKPREQVWLASLATVLRTFNVKPTQQYEKMYDRCPTYISKDKRFKDKLSKVVSRKNIQLKGHQLTLFSVFSPQVCYQCSEPIWGINAQGYECANCDTLLHKTCTSNLSEFCYPMQSGGRGKASGAGRPRKSTAGSPDVAIKEESDAERLDNNEELDELSDMSGNSRHIMEHWGAKSTTTESGFGDDRNQTNIERSQSMKDPDVKAKTKPVVIDTKIPLPIYRRQAETLPSFSRSTTKSDVDADDKPIAMAMTMHKDSGVDNSRSNSTTLSSIQSSNSISSDGDNLKTPSSTEPSKIGQQPPSSEMSLIAIPLLEAAFMNWRSRVTNLPDLPEFDPSDVPREVEVDENEVGFKELDKEGRTVQYLSKDYFNTVRREVHDLKTLYKYVYLPMLDNDIAPSDLVFGLFANIADTISIYDKLLTNLKEIYDTAVNHVIEFDKFYKVMIDFLSGENGEKNKVILADFVKHSKQQTKQFLEFMSKKERSIKFTNFMDELPEIVRTTLNPHRTGENIGSQDKSQGLVPMLNNCKCRFAKSVPTFNDFAKLSKLNGRTEYTELCSRYKEIGDYINQQMGETENAELFERTLENSDITPFFKHQTTMMDEELRKVDKIKLIGYRVIHESALIWKVGKKSLECHAFLIEEYLVIFTKANTKYTLRYHNNKGGPFPFCPLIKLKNALLPLAERSKELVLVSTDDFNSQIYNFAFIAESEKMRMEQQDKWRTKLSEQLEKYSVHVNPSNDDGIPAQAIEVTVEPRLPMEPPIAVGSTEIRGNLNDSGVSDASQGEDESPGERQRQSFRKSNLVYPDQITVTQAKVYQNSKPVLSPDDQITQLDEQISECLRKKQSLIAQKLEINESVLRRTITDCSLDLKTREPKELLLCSFAHSNHLFETLKSHAGTDNSALALSVSVMKHLSELVMIEEQRDKNTEQMRDELRRLKGFGLNAEDDSQDYVRSTTQLDRVKTNNTTGLMSPDKVKITEPPPVQKQYFDNSPTASAPGDLYQTKDNLASPSRLLDTPTIKLPSASEETLTEANAGIEAIISQSVSVKRDCSPSSTATSLSAGSAKQRSKSRSQSSLSTSSESSVTGAATSTTKSTSNSGSTINSATKPAPKPIGSKKPPSSLNSAVSNNTKPVNQSQTKSVNAQSGKTGVQTNATSKATDSSKTISSGPIKTSPRSNTTSPRSSGSSTCSAVGEDKKDKLKEKRKRNVALTDVTSPTVAKKELILEPETES